MRAAQVTALGDPDVIRIVDLPEPLPGPDEVAVRVDAVGVGAWDVLMRSGRFGPQQLPYVPGAQLAGTVAALGADVDTFSPGQPVWSYPFTSLQGATAEFVCVPAAALASRPTRLTAAEAATAPVGLLTADQALELAELTTGQTLLVLGAGGNVGAFAVQIADRRGGTVIAHASPAQAEHLHGLGAATVVDRSGDWASQTKAAAPDGVDVLLDTIGADVAATAMSLLRPGGIAVTTVPAVAPTAPPRVRLLPIQVAPDGPGLARLANAFDDPGNPLRVQLGPVFPLEQTADAHRASETGSAGKIVVNLAGNNL